MWFVKILAGMFFFLDYYMEWSIRPFQRGCVYFCLFENRSALLLRFQILTEGNYKNMKNMKELKFISKYLDWDFLLMCKSIFFLSYYCNNVVFFFKFMQQPGVLTANHIRLLLSSATAVWIFNYISGWKKMPVIAQWHSIFFYLYTSAYSICFSLR